MHSDNSDGVCGAARPALVTRDGRLVFTGSGRTIDEVVERLERGEEVDPDEARIAQAYVDRT